MRSDNKALSTVLDALGLGAAKVDVAYTGINAAIDVVDEIKAKLVAAREPGVDKSKIQSEIAALQAQLISNASAAAFSGENWLSVDSGAAAYSATKSIVASFTRASDGTVSVSTDRHRHHNHQAVRCRRPVAAFSIRHSTTTERRRGHR